ncbi:MAG TPA: acylphosphatase, partial [Gemmatimonadaceae bacterium]|nr:acylphosphatase [Gemmatimonadaceae bacterium]
MTSMLTGASDAPIRRLVRVRGTVQGVGFRPHVHRLATALGLAGTVCNDDDGVLVDVGGATADVQQFVDRVVREAPAAAQVTSVEVTVATAGPTSAGDFVIAASVPRGDGAVPVTPDLATCEA